MITPESKRDEVLAAVAQNGNEFDICIRGFEKR